MTAQESREMGVALWGIEVAKMRKNANIKKSRKRPKTPHKKGVDTEESEAITENNGSPGTCQNWTLAWNLRKPKSQSELKVQQNCNRFAGKILRCLFYGDGTLNSRERPCGAVSRLLCCLGCNYPLRNAGPQRGLKRRWRRLPNLTIVGACLFLHFKCVNRGCPPRFGEPPILVDPDLDRPQRGRKFDPPLGGPHIGAPLT